MPRWVPHPMKYCPEPTDFRPGWIRWAGRHKLGESLHFAGQGPARVQAQAGRRHRLLSRNHGVRGPAEPAIYCDILYITITIAIAIAITMM